VSSSGAGDGTAAKATTSCASPYGLSRGQPLLSDWTLLTSTGFVGREITKLLLDLDPTLRIITTDVITPPQLTTDSRLKVVQADLGDVAAIEGLFKNEEVGGIIALQ
jgi:hypothetical protein